MKARLRLVTLVCLLVLAVEISLGADTPTTTTGRKLKVFLLAGQSNMEGKGDGAKLTAEDRMRLMRAQPRVRLAENRQPILPLNVTAASAGNKRRFGVDFTFGPELFFGLGLAEAWPNDEILLIKRAVGATSLYGRWNPDWTLEKATKMGEAGAEPLFNDLVTYVREVLAGRDPGDYEFCGMLWVQGEADGNEAKVGAEPAATYGKNLENLITRIRRETGVADLPFVMVEVGSDKVVAGMNATAKLIPRVSVMPQSTDPLSPNFFPKYEVGHYNYEGQKRIGTLAAQAYLKDFAAR